MRALAAVEKATRAARLAEFPEELSTATCEELVDITLVGDVEDKLVLGCAKHPVHSNRELNHAEVGTDVAAILGRHGNQFVANFLGRSNFFTGIVNGHSGDDALITVQGNRFALPVNRLHSDGDRVHLGVRPEKLRIQPLDDADDESGLNRIEGVISDSAFIGVSTEYLVRTAWGQQVSVFAQNTRRIASLVPGCKVVLSWDPQHTFALDASQDAAAGSDVDDEALVDLGATAAVASTLRVGAQS